MSQNSWHIRRRVMFACLAFCMICIGYVLGVGLETEAASTAVSMGFAAIISIVGSYVFGAVWDDKSSD